MVFVCCVVFAVALAFSSILTWLVRHLANRYGWTLGSSSAHHIHERQVPRLGGLAVFLAFFGVLALYLPASHRIGVTLDTDTLKLLVPAVFLFATGLVDDLRELSARAKLLGQIIGGMLLYAGGLHLFGSSLQNFNPWVGSALSFAATVFFVVLMCNAINLIDGLDGLAAGVALFSMASILIFAAVGGAPSIVLVTVMLGGSVAGFLFFNAFPASIFLGDSGSLFLGFMLSGLVIALSRRQEDALNSFLLPVFCFALPLADTTISVLRRFLSRRPLFQADRGHVHHMLLNLGMSHRSAVWTLYGVAAFCTVLSLILLYPSPSLLACGGAGLFLMVVFCVRKLRYQEFSEVNRIWQRMREHRAEVETAASQNGHQPAAVYLNHLSSRQSRMLLRSEAEVDEFATAPILPDVQAEEATG